MLVLQNVSEVNRERSRLTAASSVDDSTKHNGLVRRLQYRKDLNTQGRSKKGARGATAPSTNLRGAQKQEIGRLN